MADKSKASPFKPATTGAATTGATGPRAIGMVAGATDAPPAGATPEHYDEDMFLVAARYGKNDKKSGGDTELFSFKVQESYKAWARLIVERGKFPFQSISDIGRLGLALALRWLETIDPNEVTGGVMHQIAQMEEVVAWEMRSIAYVKFIDGVSAMVAEQLALPKGRMQVGKVLRRLKKHIAAMDRRGLQAFYVAHFEKMFDDRFAALSQAGLILLDNSNEVGDGGEEREEHDHGHSPGHGSGSGNDSAAELQLSGEDQMMAELDEMLRVHEENGDV